MSANGDEIVRQVNVLRPRDTARIETALADLKAFQETHSLRGLSVRQMIEEGPKR